MPLPVPALFKQLLHVHESQIHSLGGDTNTTKMTIHYADVGLIHVGLRGRIKRCIPSVWLSVGHVSVSHIYWILVLLESG